MHDTKCKELIDKNKNLLVPWYLMAAFMYETEDDPIISDHVWDEICVRLMNEWDDIEHFHKHLIEKDSLESGTASYLKELPNRIINAAKSLSTSK